MKDQIKAFLDQLEKDRAEYVKATEEVTKRPAKSRYLKLEELAQYGYNEDFVSALRGKKL